MRKKITVKQLITLGALIILILTGVAVVIALRYFQSIPEPTPHKKIVQEISKTKSLKKDKTLFSDIADHSSNNLYAYKQTTPSLKKKSVSGWHKKTKNYSSSHRIKRHKEIVGRYRYHNNNYNKSSTSWSESSSSLHSSSTTSSYSSIPSSTNISQSTYNDTAEDITPSISNSLVDSENISEQVSSQNDNTSQEENNYAVTVSRRFVSGSFDKGKVEVTLSVLVNNPPNGLIVKEYIPEGWVISESTPSYMNFNSSTGEVKWLFMGTEVKDMEIRYTAIKKETIHAESSFYGIYLYNDINGEHITMQTGGEDRV